MLTKSILLVLGAASMAAAHGKVSVVTGSDGGNGTALAIKGGVVPGPGPNGKTEKDTTVFKSTKIMTDGLGKTAGGGAVKVADIAGAMAQSGQTLPQISSSGGTLSGTWHIVTTDGAGPVGGVLDPTGTGSFSNGVKLQVTQQVTGKGGNIRPDGTVPGGKRSLLERAVGLFKRASNVNKDEPMAFAIPAGTKCTGTMGGQNNVCLVKIANFNAAGPFGGVVPIQIVDGAATPATPAAGAADPATAPAAASAKTAKTAGKKGAKAKRFEA